MNSVILLILGALGFSAIILILKRFVGFAAQNPSDYTNTGTQFDVRRALNGSILCEGVIYGPLGRVTSRFVADMNAEWQGNIGRMTEAFRYDNGNRIDREWTLNLKNDGTFEATAPDVIGTGQGVQSGSGVRLKYALKLPQEAGGHVLNVTDWMYMMENGTIINRSQMRKYGVKVAELVATMRKAA